MKRINKRNLRELKTTLSESLAAINKYRKKYMYIKWLPRKVVVIGVGTHLDTYDEEGTKLPPHMRGAQAIGSEYVVCHDIDDSTNLIVMALPDFNMVYSKVV